MNSFVSIIIPANESSDDIRHLLDALAKQSYQKFELIVIDSSEQNIVESFIKESKYNLRITYKRIPYAFPGEARNLGVSIASHKIIAFLDVRTIPEANWLERGLLRFYNKNIDFICGTVLAIQSNKFQDLLRACSYGARPINSVAGSLMKKEFFQSIGNFIPSVMAGEDQEWLSRINFNSPHVVLSINEPIQYTGLPKNLSSACIKWFKYSMSSSSIDVQKTQKFAYFFLLFSILFISVFSWNYIIAGESWANSPYFIPHITKIFLISTAFLFFITRGLVNPIFRGSQIKNLLPFKFIFIALLGILLDLIKAPGRLLGSITLFFNLVFSPNKAHQNKKQETTQKILVLCPYPYDEAAGQRLKYEQYFYHWKENNFDITLSSFFSKKTWNILYLKGHLLQKIIGTITGYCRRIYDLWRVSSYDKVYVFLWVTPIGGKVLQKLIRRFSKKLIFDFDDSIHLLKEESGEGTISSYFKSTKKTRFLIKYSDAVITSSANNLSYCKENNAFNNAHFIPCSLDTERFVPKKISSSKSKVTIGWTGTFSSIAYLESIKDVLIRINESHDVNFLLITNFDYSIAGLDLNVIRWDKKSEIKDLQSIDIGLYPLIKSPWALGKGGLKVMQYMSIGIPSVSTNFGMSTNIITNGIEGFLVDSEDEWVNAISTLIKDEDLREKMGKLARKNIVKNFSTDAIKLKYIQVLTHDKRN